MTKTNGWDEFHSCQPHSAQSCSRTVRLIPSGKEIVTEPEFEAEFDFDLLNDWCSFCAGRESFDRFHFSTILMGVFLAGRTPEVDSFIHRYSSAFAPPLGEALLRICDDTLPDRDVLPWITRDIEQKLSLLDSSQQTERGTMARLLAEGRFTHTDDIASLQDIAIDSPNFDAIYFAESDYVIDCCAGDLKMYALRESLYHIATDYSLAHSIMSPLLPGSVDLSNYLEVYLRGGSYVLGVDSIVVCQYQP